MILKARFKVENKKQEEELKSFLYETFDPSELIEVKREKTQITSKGEERMKYKFEIFEIYKDGKKLRVVQGEGNNLKDIEKELFHYAFLYAQDYPIEIKKNWGNSQSITKSSNVTTKTDK